ncbi:MAG TPA: hypothetical protein VN541_24555 [Tepidisphaeraceae bacterium]|nr:hypothetical protein [Tepidisphaeraceae bacterium]
MDESLKQRVAMLLAEAEVAINPKTNGLLSHSDCNHLIAKFIVTIRRVLSAHEELERERDELSARLEGLSQFDFFSTGDQPAA